MVVQVSDQIACMHKYRSVRPAYLLSFMPRSGHTQSGMTRSSDGLLRCLAVARILESSL